MIEAGLASSSMREVGGRLSDETAQFLRGLASAKVRDVPLFLQGRAHAATVEFDAGVCGSSCPSRSPFSTGTAPQGCMVPRRQCTRRWEIPATSCEEMWSVCGVSFLCTHQRRLWDRVLMRGWGRCCPLSGMMFALSLQLCCSTHRLGSDTERSTVR